MRPSSAPACLSTSAPAHRAGARFGPMAIRGISRMLVDGVNPLNWRNPQAMPFSDIGDFEIALGDTLASLKLIEEQAARCRHLIALGGDHAITLPLLRAVAKKQGPVGLIHFDAHVDTWPDTFGQVYGHGSVFYHAIEEGLVDPHRMIQIGIRSPLGPRHLGLDGRQGRHHRHGAGGPCPRARGGDRSDPRQGGPRQDLSLLRHRRPRSLARRRAPARRRWAACGPGR